MKGTVEEYISKQKQPQKEILRKVRKIILKTLPKASEEVCWGVPVFAGARPVLLSQFRVFPEQLVG